MSKINPPFRADHVGSLLRPKALLEARLAAYEKDPDAGSSWEEVESRIRERLNPTLSNEPPTHSPSRG